MTSPFTTESYLAAANSAKFVRPENERVPRYKPRASSLISCARQQLYDLTATPITNLPSLDAVVTQELGRMAEEYTRAVVPHIASELVEPEWEGLVLRSGWRTPHGQKSGQDALPDDYWITGHPDFDLHQRRFKVWESEIMPGGPMMTNRQNEWKETLADGFRWGVEHKFYGAYQYEKTVQHPDPLVGAPGIVAQGLLYGDALGWDKVIAVVLAQDASLIRGKVTQARRYAATGKAKETRERNQLLLEQWERVNPKVHIFDFDVREMKHAYIPELRVRADAISELRQMEVNPDEVARERNPEKHPLCSYCPWQARCEAVGRGGVYEVPQSPIGES